MSASRIKIKLEGGIMPKKATPFDAAYDVYVPEDTDLKIGRQCIDLKFRMELPHGMAAFIRARSGYSLKGIEAIVVDLQGKEHDVRIDADVTTGLCDEKYRGTVGALVNFHFYEGFYKRVYLKKGTRIAQMQIVNVPTTDLVEADELDMTDDRGGGFGHTNK
jgi:dUTP pyrophosphatase